MSFPCCSCIFFQEYCEHLIHELLPQAERNVMTYNIIISGNQWSNNHHCYILQNAHKCKESLKSFLSLHVLLNNLKLKIVHANLFGSSELLRCSFKRGCRSSLSTQLCSGPLEVLYSLLCHKAVKHYLLHQFGGFLRNHLNGWMIWKRWISITLDLCSKRRLLSC